MEDKEQQSDESDERDSIADALRNLRDRPVDTARLGRRIRASLGLPGATTDVVMPTRISLNRLAAIFLLAGSVVGMLCWWVTRPVMASPAELAQAHFDNIAGEPGAIAVTSMAEAHRVIAAQWARCPHPTEPRTGAVISCHLHILGGKRLLCVKLSVDDIFVTLAVGHSADLRLPNIAPVNRGAIPYFIQKSGETNIVTTVRAGQWLSVMGQTSPDRLMDIARATAGEEAAYK